VLARNERMRAEGFGQPRPLSMGEAFEHDVVSQHGAGL
jgi:hypothetical protein